MSLVVVTANTTLAAPGIGVTLVPVANVPASGVRPTITLPAASAAASGTGYVIGSYGLDQTNDGSIVPAGADKIQRGDLQLTSFTLYSGIDGFMLISDGTSVWYYF